jgi:hypothetical protein
MRVSEGRARFISMKRDKQTGKKTGVVLDNQI